jgi:hypothetical protein
VSRWQRFLLRAAGALPGSAGAGRRLTCQANSVAIALQNFAQALRRGWEDSRHGGLDRRVHVPYGGNLRKRIGLLLLLMLAASAAAQDMGPSILSRGARKSNRGGRDPMFFRAYGSIGYAYETGISPISLDSAGRLENISVSGLELDVGAYARRDFRRGSMDLDYRGDVRHYPTFSFYDASDHYLSLSANRQFTKRWEAGVREMAGTLSRSNSGYIVSQLQDPSFVTVPTNELFDNRSYFLQSSAEAMYHQTSRLQYMMGADGFMVRRRSKLLLEVDGYDARGGVDYRLSKTLSIQGMYNYTRYNYRRALGGSDIHAMTAGFTKLIGRHWKASLMGGAYYMESLGTRVIAFDPAVQQLTGRTGGVEAFYDSRYGPAAAVELSRMWAKSSVQASYRRTTSPGNGLFLTSWMETSQVVYSHTARQFNFGITGGYVRATSLIPDSTKYSSGNAGGGITYRLSDSLHINTRLDWRKYLVDRTDLQRSSVRLIVSLAFSPGEKPLTLW